MIIGSDKMSRLQVGGLALAFNTINPEKEMTTVKLFGLYKGEFVHRKHGLRNDFWVVESEGTQYVHPEEFLIPLGDEQTQEELRKESIEQKKQQEHSERV